MPILIRKVHLKIRCVSLVHKVLVAHRMVSLDHEDAAWRKHLMSEMWNLSPEWSRISHWSFLIHVCLSTPVVLTDQHAWESPTSADKHWEFLVLQVQSEICGYALLPGAELAVSAVARATLRTSSPKRLESTISITTKVTRVGFSCFIVAMCFYYVSFPTDRMDDVITVMLQVTQTGFYSKKNR